MIEKKLYAVMWPYMKQPMIYHQVVDYFSKTAGPKVFNYSYSSAICQQVPFYL